MGNLASISAISSSELQEKHVQCNDGGGWLPLSSDNKNKKKTKNTAKKNKNKGLWSFSSSSTKSHRDRAAARSRTLSTDSEQTWATTTTSSTSTSTNTGSGIYGLHYSYANGYSINTTNNTTAASTNSSTIACRTRFDVEKFAPRLPLRLELHANLLSGRVPPTGHHHYHYRRIGSLCLPSTGDRDSLEQLLSAPTLEELAVRGQNQTAPRRLFFGEFEYALKTASKHTLAQVELHLIDLQPQQIHGPAVVEEEIQRKTLAKTLATLNNIDTIIVHQCRICSLFLPQFLHAIQQLPHLTHLQLHLLDLTPFQEEMISRAAFQWLQKSSLETLSLNFGIHNVYVWQTLQEQTSTKLRRFECHVADSLKPVQLVLTHNHSLQHLTLHVEREVADIQPLMEGLRHNTGLQSLTLYWSPHNQHISAATVQQALEHTLQYTNLTLCHVALYRGQERLTTKLLDFYGHLNAHIGRRRLFLQPQPSPSQSQSQHNASNSNSNNNQKEWIHKIIQHKDDTPVVYYLLQNQLELFGTSANTTTTTTTNTTTRKKISSSACSKTRCRR